MLSLSGMWSCHRQWQMQSPHIHVYQHSLRFVSVSHFWCGILLQSNLFTGTCGAFVLVQGILDDSLCDQYSHIRALSMIFIVSVRFNFCLPVSMLSLFSFQRNSVNNVCGRFSRLHDMSAICSSRLSQRAAISSADASINPQPSSLSEWQNLPCNHCLSQLVSDMWQTAALPPLASGAIFEMCALLVLC